MKTPMLPIVDGDVSLRLIQEADLPKTLEWRNKPSVRGGFHHSDIIGWENHLGWYQQKYLPSDSDLLFIIELAGRPVGQVSLYNIDGPRAEFGRLMIGEDDVRERGIAKRASLLLLKFAFETLMVRRIYLSVKNENARALGLYQRIGFEQYTEREGSILMHLYQSHPAKAEPWPTDFTHTVIVSCYNRPHFLRQALQSVADQMRDDIQVIIADDGSEDPVYDVIREVLGGLWFTWTPKATIADQRVALVVGDRTKDEGSVQNRAVQRINDAIPFVRGRIVHYLADDDWYAPGRFEVFDKAFEDPKVMVAYGHELFTDVDRNRIGRGIFLPFVDDPYNKLDHNQVCHRSDVFRWLPRWRDAIDNASDGHWFRDMAELWPFKMVDQVVAYHRFHDRQMTKAADGKRE